MSYLCAECRAVVRDRIARIRHVRRGHRIVDLTDAKARAGLRDGVEPPRRRASGWLVLIGTCCAIGVIMRGYGKAAQMAYVGGVALTLLLVAAVAAFSWRAREGRRHRLGQERRQAGAGLPGVVAGAEDLTAPVSGRRCVAYGIRLMLAEGLETPRLVLHEQLTSGFRIQTASGDVLVDPGAVVLQGPWTKLEPRHVSKDLVRYLVALDPWRADPDAGADPFAWDAAEEIVIAAGDRVSLRAETTLREENEAGLRAPARMARVAEEEPTVELVAVSTAPEGEAR